MVWQIIVDVKGYNDWNPFVTYVNGEVREGSDLDFNVHLPGAQTTPTRVRVLEIVPEKKFVWLGHLMNIKGIIDGTHTFELIADELKTKVLHYEQFEGKMLSILGGFTINHVGRGLHVMNSALKWRAEKVYASEFQIRSHKIYIEQNPEDLSQIHWDAIVIGTGMGGSTLGYALARKGQRVLFLEKGLHYLNNPSSLRGDNMETLNAGHTRFQNEKDMYANAGRWRGEIYDNIRQQFARPVLGEGTGGSSVFSGMVMERFFPEDFHSRDYHRNDKESTLPERWPITYEELRPFYIEAEKLYRVEAREGADPLKKDSQQTFKAFVPKHISTRIFISMLKKKKLNIYNLPRSCEWKTGCRQCRDFLCDRECRNDAVTICLQPALNLYGAALVTRFNVMRLETDNHRVTHVIGQWRDEKEVRFQGRRIILAAGALATPLILKRSQSEFWPQGLANRSGAVGRNLMRQLIDIYQFPSFWNYSKEPFSLREIGFNDLYIITGKKYGTVQSYGKFPSGFIMFDDFIFHLQQQKNFLLVKIANLLRPTIIRILDKVFAHAGFLMTMMEDLPQWENRVELHPVGPDGRERITVHYKISHYDKKRLKEFRGLFKRAVFPYPNFQIGFSNSLNFMGHTCGTCRFGDDPRTSVLNKMNRAHDVDNLYVVDSSFFPSSGGINPALTIAANALRVAEHILQESANHSLKDFSPN